MRIWALPAVAVVCLSSISRGQEGPQGLTPDQAVSWALDHNPKVIAARKTWEAARASI